MNKLNKFLIVWVAITFICSSWFYHTNKMKALQSKYEKTCELSVKKSEKISQLVKELASEKGLSSREINKTIKPKRVIMVEPLQSGKIGLDSEL